AEPEVEREAETGDKQRQLVRLPAALDDLELAPVGEPANLVIVVLTPPGMGRIAGAAVDEKDAPAGIEQRADEPPELHEALLGRPLGVIAPLALEHVTHSKTWKTTSVTSAPSTPP